MKYPKTQRGNPHRLTINQHVFPAQSLRRFTNSLGELMVRLQQEPKIIKLRPNDPLFCAKRAWDQRAEGLVMKQVEDAFQVIAEQIQHGRASLDADQHDVVTYFYSLWRLRVEHRENPTPDTPVRGVTPSKESLDQREFMESKHLYYVDPNGNIPGRVMGGLRIQMGMDRFALENPGLRWSTYRRFRRLVARMSKAFSLICRTVLIPASGKKKPKWSGKSLKAQATVSPLVRSSASKSAPSVARMNFALALAVAELALSEANDGVTRPASQVRI